MREIQLLKELQLRVIRQCLDDISGGLNDVVQACVLCCVVLIR